jgi:hypothetical protein
LFEHPVVLQVTVKINIVTNGGRQFVEEVRRHHKMHVTSDQLLLWSGLHKKSRVNLTRLSSRFKQV